MDIQQIVADAQKAQTLRAMSVGELGQGSGSVDPGSVLITFDSDKLSLLDSDPPIRTGQTPVIGQTNDTYPSTDEPHVSLKGARVITQLVNDPDALKRIKDDFEADVPILVISRCVSGHETVLRFDRSFGVEFVESFAQLADGTSPLYTQRPGDKSAIGKCCWPTQGLHGTQVCGKQFKNVVVG